MYREHADLSPEQCDELQRLAEDFEVPEEHIADPALLVRIYSR